MKIACLLGSPRPKGNSAILAKRLCDAAEKLGASVQTFLLNELNYKGCQACMACKTKLDKCAVQDDLTGVLENIREADVLVMATPIYFGEMTSQMKGFLDRVYSYLVPDYMTNPKPCRLAPGKKLVFIQVQGQPNETLYADVYPRIENFFKRYGFAERYFLLACGVRHLGDISAREESLRQAEEVGKRIMS